jgi:regulator of protease activity HflC (stomatin/prohibitin superfamily)
MIYVAFILLLAAVALRLTPAFRRGQAYASVLLVAAILLGLAGFFTIVPAGHVGVPVLFGSVRDTTIPEGLHFVNPLANVIKLNARVQEYTMSAKHEEAAVKGDDAITALSQDGLNVRLEVTVWFKLIPDQASKLYRELGPDYVSSIVRPAARRAIREEAVLYPAEAFYRSERLKLVAGVKTHLDQVLRGKGISLDDVLLRNVQLPQKVQSAIEEKLKFDQEAQQMEYILAKEKKEAERKTIEGEGIANFQKIVTQGISEQLLKWKGIEATEKLAQSPNSKVVIIGGKDGLPIILNPPSGK